MLIQLRRFLSKVLKVPPAFFLPHVVKRERGQLKEYFLKESKLDTDGFEIAFPDGKGC